MTTALDDAHSVRARLGDAGESNAIGPDDIDKLHDPAKRLAAWRRLITDTVESVTVAPAMTADGRPSRLWNPRRIDIRFRASIHREAARSDYTCSSTPSGPTTRTTLPTIAKSNVVVGHDFRDRKKQREDRRQQYGEIRPYRERGPAPSAWRLRRASDGHVRLQVAADRSASKHGGGSCNRPPKRACRPVPPEDRTVDHADRLASGG